MSDMEISGFQFETATATFLQNLPFYSTRFATLKIERQMPAKHSRAFSFLLQHIRIAPNRDIQAAGELSPLDHRLY